MQLSTTCVCVVALPSLRHDQAWVRTLGLPLAVFLDTEIIKGHLLGRLHRARNAIFHEAWLELNLEGWVSSNQDRNHDKAYIERLDRARNNAKARAKAKAKAKAQAKAFPNAQPKAHPKAFPKAKAKAKAQSVPKAQAVPKAMAKVKVQAKAKANIKAKAKAIHSVPDSPSSSLYRSSSSDHEPWTQAQAMAVLPVHDSPNSPIMGSNSPASSSHSSSF